jgi:conjugative transfer pilus assembly protein TraH
MKYLKRIFAIFTAFVLMISLSIPTSADMSTFLDRTMDQLKGINLKAYEGQERGYLMGGSAAIRFDQYEQPLISLTSPSLKAGCGGIDIVMGGFSYLNFEYLVQKFQAILSTAPAFAFQIALKTLCESCADVLSSLDNLANQINNLNVNSCQASKAIGALGGQKLAEAIGTSVSTGSASSWFKGLADDINDFSNSYKKFITQYAGQYDCYSIADLTARKTCLGKVGKVSFITPLMTQAFNDMEYDFPFESVFRAYFGDIYEDPNSATADSPHPVVGDPGCFPGQSTSNIMDAIVEGRYMVKTYNSPNYVNAACSQVDLTAQRKGLKDQVEDDLTAMVSAIRTNTPLTQAQINLVNASRVPIYRLLSLAILVERLGGDTSGILTSGMIQTISKPLAYDIAHQVLLRVYSIAAAKMNAAAVSKDMPEAVAMIKPMLERINFAVTESSARVSTEWEIFSKTSFGESLKKEAEFQAFIYQTLAKNKLLDSYLFAKGIR